MKWLTSPIPKTRTPKFKNGPRDHRPTTPSLGIVCHPQTSTCCGQSVFYVWSFSRSKGRKDDPTFTKRVVWVTEVMGNVTVWYSTYNFLSNLTVTMFQYLVSFQRHSELLAEKCKFFYATLRVTPWNFTKIIGDRKLEPLRYHVAFIAWWCMQLYTILELAACDRQTDIGP